MTTELDRLYDALPAFLKDDTRTDAERAYDAQRDGSAYVKPEPRSPQFAAGYRDGLAIAQAAYESECALAAWIDQHLPVAADEPADDARRAIDLDFDRVIDRVAELPDHQRAAAIAMWEGLLIGLAIGDE